MSKFRANIFLILTRYFKLLLARFQLKCLNISQLKNDVICYKNRVISLVDIKSYRIKARDLMSVFWSSALCARPRHFLPCAHPLLSSSLRMIITGHFLAPAAATASQAIAAAFFAWKCTAPSSFLGPLELGRPSDFYRSVNLRRGTDIPCVPPGF